MPRGEGNIRASGLVPAACSARACSARAASWPASRYAGLGAGRVDGAAPLAALGGLQVELPGDLDDLAVHGDDPGGRGDLGGGQGEQLALPQPGVRGGVGHQLVQVPAPPGGQGPAEPGHVSMSRDLGRVDEQGGFPGDGDPRAGRAPAGGLPVHLPQPGAGQVPGCDPRGDHGRQAPAQPGALACGGGGVDDALHVGEADVLAADRREDWGDEPLAQPPLGVGVLAGPRPPGRVPVRGQVPGDQVRAGPLQVRRVGLQPLGHLPQLRGEPGLGDRLAQVACPSPWPR